MLLKRHYKTPEGWVREVDEKGNCTNPPPLDYIEVKHTGASPEQNFSDTLVTNGLLEGWISIKDGIMTLHGKPEDLCYRIVRVPGKYPSETSPSGYEVTHAYECVLEAMQHERYHVGTVTARKEAELRARGVILKPKAHRKGAESNG